MQKAIIFYKSRKGKTKKFGENILEFLNELAVTAEIRSIDEEILPDLSAYDYIFLGCWTKGLMLLFQKPEKSWREFAAKLPPLDEKMVVLFTTYNIRTGSMFENMEKLLKFNNKPDSVLQIKSRKSVLNEKIKMQLKRFVN